MLLSDTDLISRLNKVYTQGREFEQVDADSALYNGLISREDRLRCNQLLAATGSQLADWPSHSFEDERLQTLLFRYRARNYPDSLTQNESVRWMRFCQSRLLDGEFGVNLTLEQFQQVLITLAQQQQGEREVYLLEQLSQWVQGLSG